jgi:serine/threonine protein kinase
MTKNNIYIVTEFCRTGDMVGLIRQNGRLPELQALTYLKEIAEGYVFIEENGILHRDLKTANIFLNGGSTRIADFGFCEFVGEPRPSIVYNVGSPAYMSPESYR